MRLKCNEIGESERKELMCLFFMVENLKAFKLTSDIYNHKLCSHVNQIRLPLSPQY